MDIQVAFDKSGYGGWVTLLICAVFPAMVLPATFRELDEFRRYETTRGVVTSYAPPDAHATDEKTRTGKIEFTYSAAGAVRHGIYPNGVCRAPANPPVPGEEIPVFFDPDAPYVTTLDRRIEPFPLCVTAFVLPFMALAVIQIRRGATDEILVDPFTLSYALLSIIGAILVLMSQEALGWRMASGAAVLVMFGAPIVSWLGARWAVPSRTVENPDAPPGTRAARKAARRAAKASVHREGRREIVILTAACFFWWGILSLFLYPFCAAWAESVVAADRYRNVPGEIVESALERDDESSRPVVLYNYLVNGHAYRGDRITFGQSNTGMPERDAEAVRAPYPRGATVTVHYDPDNPARAVLDTRFWDHNLFLAFFLSVFVVVGVFLVLHTLSRLRGRGGNYGARFSQVAVAYFVVHVLSAIVLGFAGAFRPDRAWLTWFGVAAVGIAVAGSIVWPVRRGR